MSPNVNKVVQSDVVERHVVGVTIQLVFVESNEASMIHQVVHRQPLLKDVAKVLLWVL